MTNHRPTSLTAFGTATLKSPPRALAWRGHAHYGLLALHRSFGPDTGHFGEDLAQTRIAGCSTQDSSEEVADALFDFDQDGRKP